MIQMNLLARQERDADTENRCVDTEGGYEGGSRMNWEIRIDKCLLPCINRWVVRICCKAQEVQLSSL